MRLLLKGLLLAITLVGLVFGCAKSASANDIYIAQNATGAANGADCNDAYAVTFFNTAKNWGTSATQIGPGTTVHLCGTFTAASAGTTMLTVQGSGASGNPVTILFESGAVLTSPEWSYKGAIQVVSQSNITINGGSNGIIQATANGNGLTYDTYSTGVHIDYGTNITVENLTISNMYVATAATFDSALCVSVPPYASTCGRGIDVYDTSSGITIANNTIHDAGNGIQIPYPASGTMSSITLTGNTIYHTVAGILVIQWSCSGTVNGLIINANNIYDGYNWADPDDNNHLDGIMLSVSNGCSGGTNTNTISAPVVSNNFIHGNFGTRGHMTAYLFLSSDSGGTIPNALVYNNVFDQSIVYGADGGIYSQGGATNLQIYNNTFYVSPNGAGYAMHWDSGVSGTFKFQNNIVQGTDYYLSNPSNSVTASEYNLYYGGSDYFQYGSTKYNFSGWQGLGFDAHAQNGSSANLNSSYVPNAGSPAIGHGVNLTSLGITGLNSDAAGNSRPATGAWDIGAYSGPASLAPPTGLSATPH